MTNEQATELLALMAEQVKATERVTETFNTYMDSLLETVNAGFNRLENKLSAEDK